MLFICDLQIPKAMADKDTYINCAENISLACSIIHLYLQDIKTLFQDREFSEINYFHNGIKKIDLEVTLDSAILACAFDKSNVCEGAFLVFNDNDFFFNHIEYCINSYKYSFFLECWITDNYFISTHLEDKGSGLLILP